MKGTKSTAEDQRERPRSAADFKRAMDAVGFESTHPHNKVIYHGIRLLSEFEMDDDDEFLGADSEEEEIDIDYLLS